MQINRRCPLKVTKIDAGFADALHGAQRYKSRRDSRAMKTRKAPAMKADVDMEEGCSDAYLGALADRILARLRPMVLTAIASELAVAKRPAMCRRPALCP